MGTKKMVAASFTGYVKRRMNFQSDECHLRCKRNSRNELPSYEFFTCLIFNFLFQLVRQKLNVRG